MARKKIAPPPAPRGGRHVRLELTDEHAEKLRVMAAKAGMSMASYVRALVVREVERAGE